MVPTPRFDHLLAMTDSRGLFEHATGKTPSKSHGYCTDDNARLLVATAHETDSERCSALSRVALAFTLAAQTIDGRAHNRMSPFGAWTDDATNGDCWGRSVWGLGVAAVHHDDEAVRTAARRGFDLAAQGRSTWPRAMAFAALGAGSVLAAEPLHVGARCLLKDAAATIGAPRPAPWIWPEQRLAYANAALAEAMIVAGDGLQSAALLDSGLEMLAWLLDEESEHGHLSVTGVGGCDRDATRPQFDQQPIEVATMADACWRAFTVTGETRWSDGVAMAAAWFDGVNDSGLVMWDERTGGGYDGLSARGVNRNQGAESTLALVTTRQRAASLLVQP